MKFEAVFGAQKPTETSPFENFKAKIGYEYANITGLSFFPNLENDTLFRLFQDKWNTEEVVKVLEYKWQNREQDEFFKKPGMFTIRYIFSDKSLPYCKSLADELMRKRPASGSVRMRTRCGEIIELSEYDEHSKKCFDLKGECFFKKTPTSP